MKFYEMSAKQRREALVAEGALTEQEAQVLAQAALPADVAAHLSENQVGQFSLPLGVVRNLTVNGKAYQVPLATEEPSVVAAASNGARLANLNGGVYTMTGPHLVVAEVVFTDFIIVEHARQRVIQRKQELFDVANAAHPSIVARGGGLKQVDVSVVAQKFLKLTLTIDPQQAMGANIANTIAEAIGATVGQWLNQAPLVAILTNSSQQVTTATVTLEAASLATKAVEGTEIGRRIGLLSELAHVDRMRAVTHNKGIMNGISGAVLASGNDTRAVEAAVHAYATRSGHYEPLASWHYNIQEKQLTGTIEIPLTVGVVGGAMGALPVAKAVHALGGYQDVATFQQVLAALGLVQNLAALRALAGPGIQAGHMQLQASALAMAVGATGDEIEACVRALADQPKDTAHAQAILKEIRANHDH